MNKMRWAAVAAAVALIGAALAVAGCERQLPYTPKQAAANEKECGGADCHAKDVEAQSGSVHVEVPCVACHEGTGKAHASDPKKAVAGTDWTIESCAGCHEGEAATYLYDDNAQPGPFGGSQREPAQKKSDTFPQYNTIVAGHAFAKDYNEEGAHKYMLQDHYETTRGKFEVCMQCKSTKVARAWQTGKPLRVGADTEIELTHTAVDGKPAKKVTIPKGTVITYKTEADTKFVDAKAVFPDGKEWTSQPGPSQDATQNFNMLWASTVAATKDTWPYGASCSHCHDPHTAEQRLVRQAMLDSIAEKGVNPYVEGSTKDWETAPARDKRILTCAQCHVEYVCGKSGVDKKDRDAFGWAKAKDLHELYTKEFDYQQDWTNKIAGVPLIKSQHPETELFWSSVHYDAGASCSDCHMPEVTGPDGTKMRSHWFTSPYKYSDPALWAKFAEATGVNGGEPNNPCQNCHADRTDLGIGQQKTFFAKQAVVEKLLAQSVANLGKIKAAKAAKQDVNEGDYEAAVEAHRKAHVLWENLAVSENSMGFHNFEEATSSMAEAEKQVRTALEKEAAALK